MIHARTPALFFLPLALLPLAFAMADEPPTTLEAIQRDAHSTAPLLQYQSSPIGNSLGNGKTWVQKDAQSLAVTADGRCIVGAGWDEAGKGAGIYQNGEAAGKLDGLSTTSGLMASDEKYIYCGCATGIKGPDGKMAQTFGIGRWNQDGSPAVWPAGVKLGRGANNFLPIGTKWLGGAVALDGQIYIGDTATNTIRIFDRETMTEKASFPCDRPFRMAGIGKSLWVIHRDVNGDAGYVPWLPAELDEWTLAGKPTGRKITDSLGATAVAFDNKGRLLVAGPQQQVQFYDLAGAQPVLAKTLGAKDGVWGGTPGLMAPDKLLNPFGVGSDAQGNVYVLGRQPAIGGGMLLRAFSPDDKLLWSLTSSQFCDVGDVDPDSDGTDFYTRDEHFVLHLNAPATQPAWTWKGYTLDPRLDDGRSADKGVNSMFTWGAPLVRRLQGRLYYFARPGKSLGIYRQGAGEILVPSGLVDLAFDWNKKANKTNAHYYSWPEQQPKLDRWIWRDKNGDGMVQADEFEKLMPYLDIAGGTWVDSKGDIWIYGVSGGWRLMWHLPLKGFDAHQNPIYDLNQLEKINPPDEFHSDALHSRDIKGLEYFPETDTMYLSGITQAHPKEAHWGSIGTEVLRYDNWSQPTRHLRWRIVLPTDPTNSDLFFNAFAVAGNRLYVIQRYWSIVHSYDTETGKEVGLIAPGPEIGGKTGWDDMEDGLRAFHRKDGTDLVFAEDDYFSRIVMYQIPKP